MSDYWADPITRKARKPRNCDVCRRRIDPGERYEHQAGVWDGAWFHTDQCAHCSAVVAAAWNLRLLDEEWSPDSLYDALTDSRRVDVLRMAVGIKRRWRLPSGRMFDVPAIPPRACISCGEPTDPSRSYTWCPPCDDARIERVGQHLQKIADDLKLRSVISA